MHRKIFLLKIGLLLCFFLPIQQGLSASPEGWGASPKHAEVKKAVSKPKTSLHKHLRSLRKELKAQRKKEGKTEPLAAWAFVCSMLPILLITVAPWAMFIFGALAVVLGLLALKKFRDEGEVGKKGKLLALLAVIFGAFELLIVGFVILIIASL
ncbi:MAG: hypothetical protein AAFR61_10850 [Bacteroidota bacterium]